MRSMPEQPLSLLAAERCFVSQPSLSQQISKLERSLGQRLFDRLGRRVVLTDPGRLLLERAPSILAAVEDAKRRLRDIGEARLALERTLAGDQPEDGEAVRVAVDDIESLAPDRAGGAQDRDLEGPGHESRWKTLA